jgi:hypothetical protein
VHEADRVLYKESFSACTDEVQGCDGPHERPDITQPVLMRSLLRGREATCAYSSSSSSSKFSSSACTDEVQGGDGRMNAPISRNQS